MRIYYLGFPRIGAKHGLKLSIEKCWRGALSQADFVMQCQNRRLQSMNIQQEESAEWLPVGDFAHYDHILHTNLLLGLASERFWVNPCFGFKAWSEEVRVTMQKVACVVKRLRK